MQVPEHLIQIIRPKYSRPARLSDPGCDFSPEELETILRKKDAELTETDLVCIFQGALPAGEYRESVYFLPLALEHIVEDSEEVTLCKNLLRWIGMQRNDLQRDGFHDELMNFFEAWFAELTSKFVLTEDHPQDCAMAETVIETLNTPDFNGMGDRWLEKYPGKAETYEQAAWLVYFLEHHLYKIIGNSEYLKRIAGDKPLLQKAYEIILPRALNDEALLLFWSRYFEKCGIGLTS